MTNREICGRLFGVIGLIDNSHDELLRAGINIVMPYTMAKEMLQNLVLDIASSDGARTINSWEQEENEHFADAGKMMSEKEDHFADLGKKGATLPDGTPINLCGDR